MREAFADAPRTVSDVLGVSRSTLVSYLQSHENDTFYLSTPYRPYDWRSPNGDPWFNGGTPGMNCTGFIWHTLVSCGADPTLTPGLTGWVELIRNNNMECYYYTDKASLLASGVLEKGDIIWMFDNDAGGMDGISDFHHIGFFWGDSPYDDRLWHSIADDSYTWSGSNRISEIQPKASNCLYVVVKTDYRGRIELWKEPFDADYASKVPQATLQGAKYTLYDEWGNWIQELVTNEHGWAQSKELSPGNYVVREAAPSWGYVVDATEHWVTVVSGNTSTITSQERAVLGALSVQKESTNTALTDNNPCYSFSGARFGIYNDEACTTQVQTITTNEKGYGVSEETLWPGTYWIKELTAPKGYSLDTTKYKLTLTIDDCQKHVKPKATIKEAPQSMPISLMLKKIDAQTGESVAEGAASLANAEFTIKFYRGYYDSVAQAEASDALQRTWVVKTDATGKAELSNISKVSGDPFFYDSRGKIALPLGTVTIRETKAPQGYNLDDGAGGTPIPFISQIKAAESSSETVSSFNSPQMADSVQRGDYRVMKVVPTTLEPSDQALTKLPVEGIEFTFMLDNPGGTNDGQTVDPATGLEWRITTDKNGYADTTGLHTGNGKTVQGALPYGTYTVQEVVPQAVFDRYKAEYGLTLTTLPPWKITISQNKQFDPIQMVENVLPQSALKVMKVDAETGETINAQATFRIYNAASELISSVSHYPEETILSEWTTINGTLSLPMKLMAGTYYLEEVAAPEGYALSSEWISFEIPADAHNDWNNPITVVFSDNPLKGSIEIAKTDSDSGDFVNDAEYSVCAVNDIVTHDGTLRAQANELVASGIRTNDEGSTVVEGLYLGLYKVYETKAPTGYALDTEEHEVAIESEGQDVPTVYTRADVQDAPTGLKITKIDSVSGEPLAGATFRVQHEKEGVFNESFTTDDSGTIVLSYLPHGRYSIVETEAPTGYLLPLDQKPLTIFVDDQGQIEGRALFEITLENDYTKLSLSKTDVTTGQELPGATLTLTDKNKQVVATWVSTTEPHRIDGLDPGKYFLTETIAPSGYEYAETISFTLQANGQIQKVVMKDEPSNPPTVEPPTPTPPPTPPAVIPRTGDSLDSFIPLIALFAICGVGWGVFLLRKLALFKNRRHRFTHHTLPRTMRK